MKINCPKCGEKIAIKGFGRRPLNIVVTKVCDALQLHHSVLAAAKELGCSRGYIYQELNKKGLKPKDIIRKFREQHPPSGVCNSGQNRY